MIAIISPKGLIVGLLAPMSLSAQERRPHSVLVLDQSDLRRPKANRPIVVVEPLFAAGETGGYSLIATEIGADAGRLALRILNGEQSGKIPLVVQEARPLFDWKQMQRWNISASDLPEGSQIRLREPAFFEQYRWQSLAILAALSVQAALIIFLLHERHLRRDAEAESRKRMSELAHVSRRATAGELSSSFAHELNQPLGSILANAETMELMLNSEGPDLDEISEVIRAENPTAGGAAFRCTLPLAA